MKQLYTVLVSLLCFSAPLLATDNPGSATSVVMQNWFVSDGATTYSAGTLGATGSIWPVCNGASEDDDMWLTFTAQTVGVKITVQNPAFDAVIQLYNSGLSFQACENTVAGNNTEILRYNQLTVGQQYFVRIHSLNGNGGAGTFNYAIEYLPQSEVRLNWYDNPPTDLGMYGYRIYENTNRAIFLAGTEAPFIQATQWLFIDTATGLSYSGIKSGTSSLMLLDDVDGLCFGKTYDVYVQVQLLGENYWCGYSVVRQIVTEAFPNTELEPGYGGQHYNLNQFVKARYLGSDQVIEFELVTDNYTTTVVHDTTSSFCYFDYVDCIRYNKIYQIRTRASYCGSAWGPWSVADYIITNPMPYTYVTASMCNTIQFIGSTLTCQYVWGTNQYAWQFAPIEPGDVTMTPIGPAIVVYTPHTSCYLLQTGLTYGVTYRVAAKPFLGFDNMDGCDDHQEGDYGTFCSITIFDPFQFTGGGDDEMQLDYNTDSEFTHTNFDVGKKAGTNHIRIQPTGDGSRLLMVDMKGMEASGTGIVSVHDMFGRLIQQETFQRMEAADYLAVPLNSNVSSGIYIITVESEGSIISEKIFAP